MSNRSSGPSFPASQQDIARLKQTAIDAVNDLGSTAIVHATKARGQLGDFADHVQEEGGEQLDHLKGRISGLVCLSREYVAENPLLCVGAALALGFLIGLTSRRRSTN